MEDEESVVTEEVRARVGKETEPREFVLGSESVMQIVAAAGEDPAPFAAEGAEVPLYAALALDRGQPSLELPILMPASLLNSNEWEFFRPPRVGERLVVRGKIGEVRERFGGQFGHSVIVRFEYDFRTPDGELVARSARALTEYDPKGGR